MKLTEEKLCNHPNENPFRCDCAKDCSCRATTCKHDFNAGYEISDLDMKAALRERDTKKFPVIKSVQLESCTRCGKRSPKVIWEAICEDCAKQQPLLIQIFGILAKSLNHHGIISWFLQPHPALNGRTPSRAIDDGDLKDVFQLAKNLE